MLNTQHFTVIHAASPRWDEELRREVKVNGRSLTEVQEAQFAAGFRSAEIVKSGHGYVIRSATGLNGFRIIATDWFAEAPPSRAFPNGSYESAVEWAKAWAEVDPDNREVFIRNTETP
jgi:hypothetical protein